MKLNNFYFSILDAIRKDGRLPKDMGTPQRRQYYINSLSKSMIIQKIGYGQWRVNEDKLKSKELKTQVGDSKNIRGHGYIVKLQLPQGISRWKERRTFLKKEGIEFKESKANWVGERIIIFGFKVWLTDKSIIVYCPDDVEYIASSGEEAEDNFLNDLGKIITKLNNLFLIDIRKFKICRRHYGKIKDALAKECLINNLKMKCFYNGECWQLIDNSKGYIEREAVHKITSQADIDNIIIPMENSLKEYYATTGEQPSYIKLMRLIEAIAVKVAQTEEPKINKENLLRQSKEDKQMLLKPFYIG